MTTINELMEIAKAEVDKSFRATGLGAYTNEDAFRWITACYDSITGALKIPRKTASLDVSADQSVFTIPTDCWGQFHGLLAVEYDDKPLTKKTAEEFRNLYGVDWKNPTNIDSTDYFVEGDTSTTFRVIKPCETAGTGLMVLVYVQQVPKPTSTSDNIPAEFEQFRNIIPDFLVGKMMTKDKQGRGAAKIAEFEARLKKEFHRNNRKGRYQAGESYTAGLQSFRRNYSRSRGKGW